MGTHGRSRVKRFRTSTKITIVVIVVVLVGIVLALRAIPSAQRPTLVPTHATTSS